MAGAFYTPDEIDAMPAQDVFALLHEWCAHPPTHEILAAVHRVTIEVSALNRASADCCAAKPKVTE